MAVIKFVARSSADKDRMEKNFREMVTKKKRNAKRWENFLFNSMA